MSQHWISVGIVIILFIGLYALANWLIRNYLEDEDRS